METTFNKFKESINWYFDKNESMTLVWEDKKYPNRWEAELKTGGIITTILIRELAKHNIGIAIRNNKIYLYH